MPTKVSIDRFLDGELIAFIGVSRNPKSFANSVYRAMRDGSYCMVPVNSHADEVEGDRCYRTVADIPDVDGAVIMVSPDAAAGVVTECADRGIARVWLHKGSGAATATPEAVQIARDRGLDVVDGACPLMFLEHTGLIHRMHRWISGRKIAVAAEAA